MNGMCSCFQRKKYIIVENLTDELIKMLMKSYLDLIKKQHEAYYVIDASAYRFSWSGHLIIICIRAMRVFGQCVFVVYVGHFRFRTRCVPLKKSKKTNLAPDLGIEHDSIAAITIKGYKEIGEKVNVQ